eukprot:2432736-Pyramimonas_sp.AAC.1
MPTSLATASAASHHVAPQAAAAVAASTGATGECASSKPMRARAVMTRRVSFVPTRVRSRASRKARTWPPGPKDTCAAGPTRRSLATS